MWQLCLEDIMSVFEKFLEIFRVDSEEIGVFFGWGIGCSELWSFVVNGIQDIRFRSIFSSRFIKLRLDGVLRY